MRASRDSGPGPQPGPGRPAEMARELSRPLRDCYYLHSENPPDALSPGHSGS